MCLERQRGSRTLRLHQPDLRRRTRHFYPDQPLADIRDSPASRIRRPRHSRHLRSQSSSQSALLRQGDARPRRRTNRQPHDSTRGDTHGLHAGLHDARRNLRRPLTQGAPQPSTPRIRASSRGGSLAGRKSRWPRRRARLARRHHEHQLLRFSHHHLFWR